MARRSVWVQMQREAERRRRDAERAARALERERARREREATRQRAYDEKERKRQYLEERTAETDQLNHELAASVEQLEDLLASTLAVDDALAFDSLKESPTPLPFEPGELAKPLTPPVAEPPAPSGSCKSSVRAPRPSPRRLWRRNEGRRGARPFQSAGERGY